MKGFLCQECKVFPPHEAENPFVSWGGVMLNGRPKVHKTQGPSVLAVRLAVLRSGCARDR